MNKLNKELEKFLEIFNIKITHQEENTKDLDLSTDEIQKAQLYVTNFLDSSKQGDKLTIDKE